jgi:hypothetical protein
MNDIEDDVTTDAPYVAPEQQSLTDLLKLQKKCIAHMRKRMPGFLVTEPVLVYLEEDIGRALARVTTPDGPIRFQARYYATYAHSKSLRKTMMHELIHLHVARANPNEGAHHGPLFQKLALYFGLQSNSEYNWRWRYDCPKCGHWIKSSRRQRGRRCPKGCIRNPANPFPVSMKESDNVKVSREERATLAGKTLPPKASKPPVDAKAAKLARDKIALRALERKQKLLVTLIQKRRRSIAARERIASKKETSP